MRGCSPLKQTIDIPFSISGSKFPSIVSEKYRELRKYAVYQGDISEHGVLRKDHPINVDKEKETKEKMHKTYQKKVLDYRKSQLTL